ncbi:MAG: AI-2E family transporter [Pseudomonadota bacterium]|nr:AI-2E family transporter [Pseudomonadota bacterium]
MKQDTARTIAVIVIFAACIYLLRGLLAPICWAGIIAISTWPLHQRLLRYAGKRSHGISAALLTGAVVAAVLVPFGYVVWRGVHELPHALSLWTTSRESGLDAPSWLGQLPLVGEWALHRWEATLGQPGALADYTRAYSHSLGLETGRTMLLFVGHRAMALFFCALVLFFLYLDGPLLAAQIEMLLLRRFGPRGVETQQLAVKAIRGTVNGLILVGLGLAVIMSIVYALAGVAHPALWGLATGLLGIVPFGAGLVLLLVVLYLLTAQSMTAAIVVFVVGAIGIFITDHFIRPMFISGASKMPLVLAILGIVAGLETFGILGIFIGPVLLAIGLTVWRELTAPEPSPPAAALPDQETRSP